MANDILGNRSEFCILNLIILIISMLHSPEEKNNKKYVLEFHIISSHQYIAC